MQQPRFVEVTALQGNRLTVLTSTDASSSVSVPITEVHGVVWHHLPWLDAVAEGLGSAAGMFYLAALLLIAVSGHLLWATTRRAPGHGASPGRVRDVECAEYPRA